MSHKKSIFIISPHPDDAVFSCGEHIYRWKKSGYEITVCTVFTQFSAPQLSLYAIDYLAACGFINVEDFTRQRASEDVEAMRILQVSRIDIGLTTGIFRSIHGQPLYPIAERVYSSQRHPADAITIRVIKQYLRQYMSSHSFSSVLIPRGIGCHIDHLLVRTACEDLFSPEQILYYADLPYATCVHNWNHEDLIKILTSLRSVALFPIHKTRAVSAYTSQRWMLPGWFSCMPEFIF